MGRVWGSQGSGIKGAHIMLRGTTSGHGGPHLGMGAHPVIGTHVRMKKAPTSGYGSPHQKVMGPTSEGLGGPYKEIKGARIRPRGPTLKVHGGPQQVQGPKSQIMRLRGSASGQGGPHQEV